MKIITGAYSYTGKYIAARLVASGQQVATLTGHPDRPDPFGGRVPAYPLDFSKPEDLRQRLTGADTLYNTYWVRFPHRGASHDQAVANTKVLLDAAKRAGVGRVVHISITGADPASSLAYFRGKSLVEQAVEGSGLGYAIIRPTIVFGREDVLINNIAWFLRRFPLLPLPGRGSYPVQPVYVEDLARLAVEGAEAAEDVVWDAAGPERLTFRGLVALIRDSIGSRARIVPAPPAVALGLSKALGFLLKDVVLTRDEVLGLMAGLLVTHEPPRGTTKLSSWLAEHRDTLGRSYASELRRHY